MFGFVSLRKNEIAATADLQAANKNRMRIAGCQYTTAAVKLILSVIALLLLMAGNSSIASAQGRRAAYPKIAYYNTFPLYYNGDFARAGRDFQRGYNTAFRAGNSRFVDSICYLTMMGECHFHMGKYSEALANYEEALKLYLSFNGVGWQSRIQVPETLSVDVAAFQKSRVSWGVPTRNADIPQIPSSFLVMIGRVDAFRALQEGGVLDLANLRPVDLNEVMRCTALCLHRRRHLLGAWNRLDPLTKRLLSGLSLANAGDGSILGAYNGVLLGIAMASMERYGDAARMLTRSLQIAGRFDHPLTPVALCELTQISIANGKKQAAASLALEASYSAGVFRQYDLVDEALSLGTTNHLMTLKTPYPPLQRAIEWADRENVRLTQLSLIQRLAECHAEAGNTAAARTAIALSTTADRRRNTLAGSVASARLKYTSAVVAFTEGNFAVGLADLSAALTQYQNGSLWLYRLRLASNLVASGSVSELEADRLFESLLHDPTEAEWKFDPIEPMSFLATDHVTAMEAWFEILIRRRQYSRALQVSELIRRHRFYSTLPLGGRLLGFRYGLNANEKVLDVATVTQRNSFLQRNGAYQKLLVEANSTQQELVKLPLQPEPGSEDDNKRRQLLARLSQVSSMQESLMASYALSREPSSLAFPPQLPFESFQGKIPKGTLCISTLQTAGGYHMFFVSRERIRHVSLGSTRNLNRAVQKLLGDLGAIGVSTETDDLNSDQWRESATKLKEGLFKDIPDDSFMNAVEIVVIPDGMLWYLPFEALPLTINGEDKFLVDLCPVRYAPTMYLSIEAPGGDNVLDRTAVAVGKMHPRGEIELTKEALEELKKNMPAAISFETQRTPSGLSAWLLDHILVWTHSLLPPDEYQMRPIPFDVSEQASVGTWMSLPWYGPEFVSLPALQTFGKGRKANGSEMFLTSMSLMASGTRTIMLPRWQTGGATALGLTRMYSENLQKDHSGPKSMRKAMIAARDLDFDMAKEPQIKDSKEPGDIKLSHPFFWAGYLVVDQPRLRVEEIVGADKKDDAAMKAMPAVNTPAPNTPAMTSPTPANPDASNADAATNPKVGNSGNPLDPNAKEKADGNEANSDPTKKANESGKAEKPKPQRPKSGGIF